MLKALHILDTMVGHSNVEVTSAMVGMHGSQFSTNPIYLFMAGPQEAVLQASLKEDFKVNMDDLKEDFRAHVSQGYAGVKVSFEPIELTDKILSQGSPTPIEIGLSGKNKKLNEAICRQPGRQAEADPLHAGCADRRSHSLSGYRYQY
jgi:hypothetical protein